MTNIQNIIRNEQEFEAARWVLTLRTDLGLFPNDEEAAELQEQAKFENAIGNLEVAIRICYQLANLRNQ